MGIPIWQRVMEASQRSGQQSERNADKFKSINERSAIGNLLQKYNDPNDPASYNQTVNQILSQVSPENRKGVIEHLASQEQQGQQSAALANRKAYYKSQDMDENLAYAPESVQVQKIKGLQPDPKAAQDKIDSDLLARHQSGEELSREELQKLSPTSLRSLIGRDKDVFEKESDKLAAKSARTYADKIEKDYDNYQMEELRLRKLGALDKTGELSTAMMVKSLEVMGLPLSILGNPANEEYDKVVADYVRDVSDVFTGQIRVFEIQAYLKTVPGLMNSPEGRERVVKNRETLNKGKKVKYDAYRKIMKGRTVPPADINMQVNDMTREQMADIADEYEKGVQGTLDKFGPTVPMISPDGVTVSDIPLYRIEAAQAQQWKIHNE